jgi:hypothetical protein
VTKNGFKPMNFNKSNSWCQWHYKNFMFLTLHQNQLRVLMPKHPPFRKEALANHLLTSKIASSKKQQLWCQKSSSSL